MSNQVTIIPTTFVNVRQGTETKGYRIFDEYDSHYNNTWDSIPDDDMELLELIVDEAVSDVIMRDMFEFIRENKKGITIGAVYYDYETIKEIVG